MISDRIFSVSGNKIETLFISEDALLFSSANLKSVDKFQEAWSKKLSLATKTKVKYQSIKSVRQENQNPQIHVYYKTVTGITSEVIFSFYSEADVNTFFDYLTSKLYFTKTEETLTPFRAIRMYFLMLFITLCFGAFSIYEAFAIQNGTAAEPSSAKSRAFMKLLGFLGPYGTLAISVAIIGYILFRMWKRFINPPDQVRFSSPNF